MQQELKGQAVEAIHAKTAMTRLQAKDFIRCHFEQCLNRKNVNIGNVHLAAGFVDHGADVPPGTPPGPAEAIQYLSGAPERFADLHVQMEDIIAEDDRVVVRNHWTATDSQGGQKPEFRGMVIWRVASQKIAARWAYLGPPHPVISS